ncbi:Histidinol-phosphate aminotransferase [Clavibacter michiganensis]|uniref:Histidinol-phosphate aminotransferase n=1 Tax=Clavibacter michiganensis TaxID=28447 RepID=A0A251XTQ8_9MICO|nr:Histidinol-phosphate aminotransferase [Clavibacter michiganensis]
MSPDWSRTTLADLPLRDGLRGEEPYGAPQLDVPVLLNVNENPYPLPDEVARAISQAVLEAAGGLNRYPDREFLELRTELADYLAADSGLPLGPENVWAANGSNEVLQQVLQAFGGTDRVALSFAPHYAMYPEYARNTLTTWVSGRRQEDFTLDLGNVTALVEQHRPAVVFLTSPNNPTGTALTTCEIEHVLSVAPGVVVIDEAYAEFRRAGVPTAVSLLPDHPRLIVSRTMSKAFAFAGGRLGYLAASPAVVDALRIVRLPYHLSRITQVSATAALRHSGVLLAQVASLRAERDALVDWLRGRGFEVAPSDANFVLFGRFPDRHAVWQGLLDRGVLIRETGPEGWLRVSVGTPEETAAFRDALDDVLGTPRDA